MPDAVIIAGANGAGKTTFARQLLPAQYPTAHFLNADEIRYERSLDEHPFAAGRELLRRLAKVVSEGESFAIETTLSSRTYAKRIPDWRASGYFVCLHFIEVPSPEFAVDRVATRVAAGGHSVPEADIKRRFHRGLRLFQETYRSLVDEWYYWVSGHGGMRLVERYEERKSN